MDDRRDSGYSSADALSQRTQAANRLIQLFHGSSVSDYTKLLHDLFDIPKVELGTVYSALDSHLLQIDNDNLAGRKLMFLLKNISAAWISVTTLSRKVIAQKALQQLDSSQDTREMMIYRALAMVLQKAFGSTRESCLVYLSAFLAGPIMPSHPFVYPYHMEDDYQDVPRLAGLHMLAAQSAGATNSILWEKAHSLVVSCFHRYGSGWCTVLAFTLTANSQRYATCIYIGLDTSPPEEELLAFSRALNDNLRSSQRVGIVVKVDPIVICSSAQDRRERAFALSLRRREYRRLLDDTYHGIRNFCMTRPGSSLSYAAEANAGTLCLLLDTSKGEQLGLTCGHVLSAVSNSRSIVYSPSVWDQAGMHFWRSLGEAKYSRPIPPLAHTNIGRHSISVLETADGRHRDWGLFDCDKEVITGTRTNENKIQFFESDLALLPEAWPSFDEVVSISSVSRTGKLPLGQNLLKVGAVTNKTIGVLNEHLAYAWFSLDHTKSFVTKILVGSTGMADEGDSGSVVVRPASDCQSLEAVGMVFGKNQLGNVALISTFDEFWEDMEEAIGVHLELSK